MKSSYPDWLRAFLLLGKHDSSYLPVLLGPDGSLYCVLQGEYLGALKTVKLDDEGRLSAFVVDSVDAWGQLLQIGNAELAARLGSLVRFDRRGTLLDADSFENGRQLWTLYGTGTGYASALSPSMAATGGYSLQLTAPTGGTDYVSVSRTVSFALATSFGLAMLYNMEVVCRQLDLLLIVYDGVHAHYISARLDYANSKIKIRNQLGNWVDVDAFSAWASGQACFRYLKVAADLTTGRYIRLLSDNAEYDISAVSFQVLTNTTYPRAAVTIQLYSPGGPSAVVDIDNVIITVNES